MTNDARYEKNLKRIQQRLGILAPIIQDVQNSCFNLGRFFVTISTTIHGGAIGFVIAYNDKDILQSTSYFIIGIALSFFLAIIMSSLYILTIADYSMYIFYKNNLVHHSLRSIKVIKFLFYIFEYIILLLSFLSFFYGVNEIFYNKFYISIIDIIKEKILTII